MTSSGESRAPNGADGRAEPALRRPLMRSVPLVRSFDGLRGRTHTTGEWPAVDTDEGDVRPRGELLASLRDFFADRWWSSDANRFYARPAGGNARLVVRDYPFHQSSGKLNMAFTLPPDARRLFTYDMFHVLVQAPTKLLLALVAGTYTSVVVGFALVYMLADKTDPTCHLGLDDAPLTFHTAFAFAVETQATIGYGIPSEGAAYFSGCPTLPIIVYCHSLMVWILNAALIGGTLARLSRANLRAVEIVFSDKACVQCIRGDFYLRFQVAELAYFRFHPAVEAHVRCYAVLHETDASAQLSCPFQTRAMRLTHPDDTRGAMLFLPVPSAIMHAIDEWSPLYPPPLARHRRRREALLDRSRPAVRELLRYPHLTGYSFPGLLQRAADLETVHAVRELVEEQDAPPGSPPAAAERARPRARAAPTPNASNGAGSGGSDAETPAVSRGASAGVHERDRHDRHTAWARGGGGSGGASGRQAQPGMTRVESAAAMDQLGLSSIGGPALRAAGGAPDDAAALRFQEELRAHVTRSDIEVIAIVEAIDPQTSNTFQARHSYKGCDIVYDHTFVPCMSFEADGRALFDLCKFHQTQPCTFNARDIGPVSSHA